MKGKRAERTNTSNKSSNASNEFLGTFLIILTAIISGASIVINKFFVVSVDPLLLTSLRAFFIGIIFFFISLYFSRKNKTSFNKVSWKWLLTIGIVGGSFAFWLFFTGLKVTTAGRAAFIHKTLPIYACILAFIFLKEKIGKKLLIALGIMLVGLVLIEFSNISSAMRTGDMLILVATILWAVESTIAKKAMLNKESNWVVVFSRMFFGAIILFALMFILGRYNLITSLTSQQLVYILVSGGLLFLYVLTYYLGLKHINLSKASTILLLSPVISLVLGMIWLNEKVLMLQLIGSLLILIGAFVVARVKSEGVQEL